MVQQNIVKIGDCEVPPGGGGYSDNFIQTQARVIFLVQKFEFQFIYFFLFLGVGGGVGWWSEIFLGGYEDFVDFLGGWGGGGGHHKIGLYLGVNSLLQVNVQIGGYFWGC